MGKPVGLEELLGCFFVSGLVEVGASSQEVGPGAIVVALLGECRR